MASTRAIIDSVTTVAILATCAALLWNKDSEPPPQPTVRVPEALQALEGASQLGDPAATVVVIEYSEFECPFCAAFERDVWPVLLSEFVTPGSVQFAFRHLPLETIHKSALAAAKLAYCSGIQGRFAETKAFLFEDQRRLSERLLEPPDHLGLNITALEACIAEQAGDQIRRDQEGARGLGITGTPTFLLGRMETPGFVRVSQVVVGAQPLGVFTAGLNSLLR